MKRLLVVVMLWAPLGACNGDDMARQRIKIPASPVEIATVPANPPRPPPGKPANPDVPPAASFAERLAEARKVYDPLPWIEPAEKQFDLVADGTDRGIPNSFSDYPMLVEDLVGVGGERKAALAIPDIIRRFDLMHEFGPSPTTIPEFMRDQMMLGTGYSDWNKYPEGLYLPQGLQQVLHVRTVGAVVAGSDGVFFFGAWRGYRLWPRGQIHPAQKTYEEYAREGWHLEPYPRTVTLTVNNDLSEVNGELTFTEDYVVDGVSVRYPPADGLETAQWGITAPFVQLRIVPTTAPIMPPGGFVSVPLVGWNYRRTSWSFKAQPLTVTANTKWKLTTRLRVGSGIFRDGLSSIDVVVYGSKLFPPR